MIAMLILSGASIIFDQATISFHETVMHAIDGCLDILIWRLWLICDGALHLFLLCILLLFAKSRMFLINFVYFPVVFLSLLVCKKLAC